MNPRVIMCFESVYSLPIHLLRQHLFCPRIPWFHEVLDFHPTKTPWVQQGECFDARQKDIFRHRSLKRFGLEQAEMRFRVPLESARWQLHGIADAILITDQAVYPVEIKLAGKRPGNGHILQVIAYGMLLQEHYQRPCPKAFILMHRQGKTFAIDTQEEHLHNVTKTRDQILHNLQLAHFPHSPATEHQCTQCEYLNYCNDRD